MNESPINIAVAQSRISPDVRENGREVRLVQEAHAAGSAVVNVPEAAASGRSKAHIKDWGRFGGVSLVGELQATADLARESGLWGIVGSGHRLMPPHRPHNSI